MEINRAAFGALAVIGVVAASSGAYLANRHNETVQTQASPLYPAPVPGVVTETENSIAAAPAATVERVAPALAEKPDAAKAPVRSTNSSPVRRAPARTAPVAERARKTQVPATSSAPAYTPPSASNDVPVTAAIEPVETTTVERTPAVQEPPRKMYDELVIPADSVIGLQVENAVSSERAKIEDQCAPG